MHQSGRKWEYLGLDLEVGSGTEVAPSDETVTQPAFPSATGMIS